MSQPASIDVRLSQAAQLVQRLERISVDSVWAHRSSGFRGSLLKWMEMAEGKNTARQSLEPREIAHFEQLIDTGLTILSRAAHEKLGRRSILR
jgi:hypothetical protein